MTTTQTSFVLSAVEGIAATFRVIRAQRARRFALRTLITMDPGRLDDLGIDAEDVRNALTATPTAGQYFEQRRATRAAAWSPAARAAA